MKPHRWVPIAAGGMLLVLGCSESRGTIVKGRVSYGGAPVTGGNMKLVFPDGKTYTGLIQGSGEYAAMVKSSGVAKVSVETETLKNAPKMPAVPQSKAGPQAPPPGGGDLMLQVYMKIPPKYADPNQSGLTVEVKGETVKNFELTD